MVDRTTPSSAYGTKLGIRMHMYVVTVKYNVFVIPRSS